MAGARFQIETLKGLLGAGNVSLPQAESCANAAVDQLLQAITAALNGLNSMLPDPLPAQRVSRRNLRDQFYSVGSESGVLQDLDTAAHAGDGWLWFLEQKHDAAPFGHLLVKADSSGGSLAMVKDPVNPSGGNESGSPVDYLNSALDQVVEVLSRIAEKANDDVMHYREAQRRQARRLI
ncbi:MAG: hypothetical protein WBW04_01330 [Nitrolancea sp.]